MKGKREPLDPVVKKRRLRRRIYVYAGLLLTLYGAYKFQPIEVDILPRRLPPKESVDPDSKKLFAKGTKIMVITAHPDDSEFYVGGTLLKLRDVGAISRHLLHTDGDKAYYFWADNRPLREIRRTEQTKASKQWGAQGIRFLSYPDGRLRATDETIGATADVIRAWNPDYIFCFDGQYPPRRSHQDHRRSGDIAFAAAKKAEFKGWIMMFDSIAANFAVGVDKVWSERLDLLAIHESQFSGKKLDWIKDFRTDAAVEDAALTNATFAEGFRCVKL